VFHLGYAPRLQLRVPNRLDINRPLLLHQMYTSYDVAFTRRWTMAAEAAGSVGEIDYTALGVALGPGQGELPADAVTQYAVGSTRVRFTGQLAPTHELSIYPFAGIRAPIGTSAEADEGLQRILPTQSNVGLGLRYAHQATAVDAVSVTTEPEAVDYDGQVTFVAVDSRVGWGRRLGLRTDLSLDGGVFGARTVRSEREPERLGDSRVFPVGEATLTGRLHSEATHWVDGTITTGVFGFFDRVRDRVDPRAQAQFDITTVIPPRWTAGVSLAAFLPITEDPRLLSDGTQSPDEVVYRAQTPVGYLINDFTRFEFGTVFAIRTSHPNADPVEISRFEMWFYVAMRFGMGTARGGAEVEQREGPIGLGASGLGTATGGQR
jgi:hypothetical protein